MRWEGHVAYTGKDRSAYRIVVRELEKNVTHGRPRYR
jgi:hypothetical protein